MLAVHFTVVETAVVLTSILNLPLQEKHERRSPELKDGVRNEQHASGRREGLHRRAPRYSWPEWRYSKESNSN